MKFKVKNLEAYTNSIHFPLETQKHNGDYSLAFLNAAMWMKMNGLVPSHFCEEFDKKGQRCLAFYFNPGIEINSIKWVFNNDSMKESYNHLLEWKPNEN